MTEEMLARRDKSAFDAGFEAGKDYIDLAQDYGRNLIVQSCIDRIDDAWIVRARDFLKKTEGK